MSVLHLLYNLVAGFVNFIISAQPVFFVDMSLYYGSNICITCCSRLIGLQEISECVACLGGYACPVLGMTQMMDMYLCEPGYYCKTGANTTTPDQGRQLYTDTVWSNIRF